MRHRRGSCRETLRHVEQYQLDRIRKKSRQNRKISFEKGFELGNVNGLNGLMTEISVDLLAKTRGLSQQRRSSSSEEKVDVFYFEWSGDSVQGLRQRCTARTEEGMAASSLLLPNKPIIRFSYAIMIATERD